MLNQAQIAQAWGPACKGLRATLLLHGKGRVTVRASLIEATKALNNCLIAWNYQTRYADTGAFVCRAKVSGNGWSNHSYATAIDINWQLNPYGGSRHHIPSALAAAICSIRTNNGKQVWNWGGYWSGTRDWMHFEIVCRPADIATGINWNTVPGPNARPQVPQPAPQPTQPKPPAPTPTPQPQILVPQVEMDDKDMRLFRDHTGAVWILSGRERTHVKSTDEYTALRMSWIPHHDLGPGSPFHNPIVSQTILNYTKQV